MDFMYEAPPPEKPKRWSTRSRAEKVAREVSGRGSGAPEGRPTDYSQKIAQAICEKIAEGLQIRDVCALPGFPAKGTFFRWVHEHEDFARAYALAKQCYAEDAFDENIAIADAAANYVAESSDDNSAKSAAVQAARLQIDTRFRTAARLAPRKYSERAIDPLLPQALPPPDNDEAGDGGAGAKIVDVANVTPLEHHPLYDQLKAWRRAAKSSS